MASAELQAPLLAGEVDLEIAATDARRQIIKAELKKFPKEVGRKYTCSDNFLSQLRFAAYIHNCGRYNRLELLRFINRPIVNGQRTPSPMFEHIVQNKRGRCGLLGPKANAWFMIAIIWIFVAFFPYAYVTYKPNVEGGLADFIRQHGVGSGLGFMVGVLLLTTILQLIFGPSIPIDQPRRYRVAFFVYYYVYKWWQSKFILECTPGLVYNNLCLVRASGNYEHVGIYVVGIAVNTIQCLWLMVVAIMVLAVHNTPDFSKHGVATDFAVAWVIAYAMHHATVFAIGLLLGQSKVYMARINHKIDQVDKPGGYDGMLHNMIANAELVVREADLWNLAELHGIVRPEGLRPSATCVRRVTIVVNNGMQYEVDLADGATHRLF